MGLRILCFFSFFFLNHLKNTNGFQIEGKLFNRNSAAADATTTIFVVNIFVNSIFVIVIFTDNIVVEIRVLFKFLTKHSALYRFNFLRYDVTLGYPGEGWQWWK